jgi:ADP-ribose pyrophosphatase YjhB (NUDIX family)
VTRPIELIARAVIVVDGRLLLARQKGGTRTFLPGGHIEFGEPATNALSRELREELGLPVLIGRFLGSVENAWVDETGRHHEVNLVFAAGAGWLNVVRAPVPREPHLEFFWQPVGDLGAANLLPAVFRDLVPRWVAGGPATPWGSTME